MKNTLLIITLLFSTLTFAQDSLLNLTIDSTSLIQEEYNPLAPPNTYQNTDNPNYWKNKMPNKSYWQQDVYYTIKAIIDEETEIDRIIDMSESFDNEDINDMVNHINIHLEKCKTIYKNPKTKDDTSKIDKHISILDTKIQLLAEQIKNFSTLSQDIASNQPFPTKTSHSDNRNKNLEN